MVWSTCETNHREVEDLGKGGADTLRIVTATGYGAFGVVEKGNITVSGGGLLSVP